MKHLKPLNRPARAAGGEPGGPDVYGYACSDCCTVWAPGWEVGQTGNSDPCPWMSDLAMCWATCYWNGQVPDDNLYPDWMDSCSSVIQDWVRLCVVPD
jgi:hypothetical protein